MANTLPTHYGHTFTPTIHTSIPPNIDPLNVRLPHPFVVVVTGAGKGLGWHIALAFAKAGCSGLSISSRTMGDLDRLEEEIRKIGIGKEKGKQTQVLKSVCDVQSEESVKNLEQQVRAKWGRVDVVIANAGIISKYVEREKKDASDGVMSNLPIGIAEDEDWSRVLDINLLGTWRISTSSHSPPPNPRLITNASFA